MADHDERSDKREKKEREEREKREKKEKKEKDKASTSLGRGFLGLPGAISSLAHRDKKEAKSPDPHSSYAADPVAPGEESRSSTGSNTSGKFGSLKHRSMIISSETSKSAAMSAGVSANRNELMLSASASGTAAPKGGASASASASASAAAAAASSTPNKPSTGAAVSPRASSTAPERTPAEVIIDSERIQPVPGPLDDPDAPKLKPGETLIDRLKVQALNISVLIFCVLLSWCLGALGMSFVWTILLIIALHKTDWKIKKKGWIVYYREQERRRRHERALNADFEKMVWLRILLGKAWPTLSHYMITTTRVATAKAIEEQFAKNKPPAVDNVLLDSVDFGTIPPEIESIKGYTSHTTRDGRLMESNNVFQVDTNISYKGDFSLRAKVYVRVTPFTPPVPFPITIDGIVFEGRARCVVTLLGEPPFVEKVDIAMVSMPKIDFKVTPLGGLDVMSISMVEDMVQASIDDIVKGMFVLPNRFTYRMPGAPISTVHTTGTSSSAATTSTAVKRGPQAKSNFVKPSVRRTLGTLKVEAVEARNLKAMDSNGKSDPFMKLRIGGVKKKTKYIEKTLDPKWHESFEFAVTNEYPKELYFACYDHDKGLNSNDLIGEATFDFSELPPEQAQDNWYSFGPQLGDVRLRLTWFPDPSA